MESVLVALEEGEVEMQRAPVDALEGLRHECRVDPVLECDLLHREAGRHEVVGHRERIGVPQVELVLAR